MQPIVEYARQALGQAAGRYRKVVEAMPEDRLNWRPGDETTNSVAQLVRHVAGGQRLIFSLALGEPPPTPPGRDVRTRGLHNDPATRAELLDLLARADAEREERLARLDALDLSEPVPGPRGEAHPRFFFIAHSVGEAREHLGHAELTRQLWEQHGDRLGGGA
jgi:hypothetical protein